MSELSISPAERSRKAHSMVLQRLQEPGMGVALAASLGVSESTVSRMKTDQLENVLAFLYAAGFKLVPQGKVCVDAAKVEVDYIKATGQDRSGFLEEPSAILPVPALGPTAHNPFPTSVVHRLQG